MATTSVPWNTGSGNITVTYQGQGNGTITVTSDANDLTVARSQQITIKTTNGSPVVTKTVTISQAAMPNLPYVDFGLPSGLMWAKGNLVKDSQGNYSIGAETDWGTYVSWGNIGGHNEGEGYNFDQTTYDSTPGASVSADIPSNDATHDICLATLGTPWHLPTTENFQELYDNTDNQWTTINGVNGWKFMKKTDHSLYVFFPAAGAYDGTPLYYQGSYGFYWSSSYNSSSSVYYLLFESSYISPQFNGFRYFGITVRPVCKP